MELQPFLSMLETYQRERQRREQEEARQRPSRPPEWAKRLDPNDFKGRTRAMLLAAQAAAPGTANQMGKGDIDLMPQHVADPVRDGINQVMEEERQREGTTTPFLPMPKPTHLMEREAGTGRVSIQGEQRPQQFPQPPAQRRMPEPTDKLGGTGHPAMVGNAAGDSRRAPSSRSPAA